MKVGDWVEVIQQSKHFNPHIKNVGYIGKIVDMHETAIQIECINGGVGAVDIDCVIVIEEPTYSRKRVLAHKY